LVFCTSCGTRKQQVSEPKFSIDECCQKNLKDSTLMTGWYLVEDSGFIRNWAQTGEIFSINPRPVITAEDIVKMKVTTNKSNDAMLTMNFGNRGMELWAIATEKSTGKRFAFVLNDSLLATPVVQSQITAGVSAIWAEKAELEKIKQQIEENILQMQK
jgi:preprotein translocase subunit SecD